MDRRKYYKFHSIYFLCPLLIIGYFFFTCAPTGEIPKWIYKNPSLQEIYLDYTESEGKKNSKDIWINLEDSLYSLIDLKISCDSSSYNSFKSLCVSIELENVSDEFLFIPIPISTLDFTGFMEGQNFYLVIGNADIDRKTYQMYPKWRDRQMLPFPPGKKLTMVVKDFITVFKPILEERKPQPDTYLLSLKYFYAGSKDTTESDRIYKKLRGIWRQTPESNDIKFTLNDSTFYKGKFEDFNDTMWAHCIVSNMWLKKKVRISKLDRLYSDLKPCKFKEKWQNFRDSIEPGDEVWHFSTYYRRIRHPKIV